jgi:hypothetical protein
MLLCEYNRSRGFRIHILYGGSVKPGNCGELPTLDNVHGALVGGASRKAWKSRPRADVDCVKMARRSEPRREISSRGAYCRINMVSPEPFASGQLS